MKSRQAARQARAHGDHQARAKDQRENEHKRDTFANSKSEHRVLLCLNGDADFQIEYVAVGDVASNLCNF